jgi:hypothetical protein
MLCHAPRRLQLWQANLVLMKRMPPMWAIYLISLALVVDLTYSFHNAGSGAHNRALWSSRKSMDSFPSDESDEIFRSPKIFFVGDGLAENVVNSKTQRDETSNSYLFRPNLSPASSSCSSNRVKLEIPLMPFETPLFPGSREFLFIYEMRFRSLMNDVQASEDKIVGRCFLSDDERIGTVGSLCRIVESRKLEDGKGFFVIEAFQRFRIVNIKQRVPYTIAEVELDWTDEMPNTSEIKECMTLASDIYCGLKSYFRISRLQALVEKKMISEGSAISVTLDWNDLKDGKVPTNLLSEKLDQLDQEQIDVINQAVQDALIQDEIEKQQREKDENAKDYDDFDSTNFEREDDDNDINIDVCLDNNGNLYHNDSNADDQNQDNVIQQQFKRDTDMEEDDEEFLSPEVRDTKPLSAEQWKELSEEQAIVRLTAFGNAVANLLSTDEVVMQQLLQCTILLSKLTRLKITIDEAVDSMLTDNDDLFQEMQSIILQAHEEDDNDADLLPPEDYLGVTLDSMIDDDLLRELNVNMTEEDYEDTNTANDSIFWEDSKLAFQ